MCHTPSSSDDEPAEEFDCEFGCQPMDHGIGIEDELPVQSDKPIYIATEHGFWQILPPQPLPDPAELTDEEQREAAQRYIQARYEDQIGLTFKVPDDEPTEDFEITYNPAHVDAYLADHIYDKMVHRETDGPDPLVQEPKGKP